MNNLAAGGLQKQLPLNTAAYASTLSTKKRGQRAGTAYRTASRPARRHKHAGKFSVIAEWSMTIPMLSFQKDHLPTRTLYSL